MKKLLVGVCGHAEVGKDTVCDMACDVLSKHVLRAKKIACATPLKEICESIFWDSHGVPAQAFYGDQATKNADLAAYKLPGWSGRKILQFIGTEGFRAIDSDVWARHVQQRALKLLYDMNYSAVFVSDVRFPEEAAHLKSEGGIIWRVLRPVIDAAPGQGLAGHASEVGVDTVVHDVVINNDGTLDDLHKLIQSRIEALVATHV